MNVGDKVTLKLTSKWANHEEKYLHVSNPIGVVGTITEILPFDIDTLNIDVTWSTFYENRHPITNTYTYEDLEVVE